MTEQCDFRVGDLFRNILNIYLIVKINKEESSCTLFVPTFRVGKKYIQLRFKNLKNFLQCNMWERIPRKTHTR